MTGTADEAFATFLVEDVILTLGTLQGALGWLESGADCPPDARAEGFARIARQITALEDRARDLWARLQSDPRWHRSGDEEELENLFRPPAPGDASATFRSRRGSA